jgi:hypothetical protein
MTTQTNENMDSNTNQEQGAKVPAIISSTSMETLEKLSNREAAFSEISLMDLEVPTFETAEDWKQRFNEALERDPNDIIDKIGRIKKAGAFSSWQAHNTVVDILCRIASHAEDPAFASDPTGGARNALLHELNLLYHSLPNAGPRRRNFEAWVCNFAAPIIQFNPKVAFHPLGKSDLDENGKPIERLLGKFTLPTNWQTTISEKSDKAFKLKEAAEMPFFRPSEFKAKTDEQPFVSRPVKDVVNPLKNALANQLAFLEKAKDVNFVKEAIAEGDENKIRELKGGDLKKTLYAKTVAEMDTYPKIEMALKAMQAILATVESSRHVPLEKVDHFCKDIISTAEKWYMEHRSITVKSTYTVADITKMREDLAAKLVKGELSQEEFDREWKTFPKMESAIDYKVEGGDEKSGDSEDKQQPTVEAKSPEEIEADLKAKAAETTKKLQAQAAKRTTAATSSKGNRRGGRK